VLHLAVRTRLYSGGALKIPESELLSTIVTLDQALEDWRQTILPDIQPGSVGVALEPHCVVLHLAFHNSPPWSIGPREDTAAGMLLQGAD
jgi:hypothetical protein